MNTEQEVEVEERDIPDGEYADRDLKDSKHGPIQSSNASKKVAMKPESKNKVKLQYRGYRRRIRKKLKRKDQEIRVYKGIIDTDSSLTQFNVDVLKRRIAKLENDKKIIIRNADRYCIGKIHRYAVNPLKVVKAIFSSIATKIRDYFNVIDIDMDFDPKSAESMLNVGFNNSNSASTAAQVQSQDELSKKAPQESRDDINSISDLTSSELEPPAISSMVTPASGGAVQDNFTLPLPETPGYSVFDNGGDELATLEDINQLNQQGDELLSQLNAKSNLGDHNTEIGILSDHKEEDSDLDQLLQQLTQVYQDEMEKQKKLQEEATEQQRQAVEAKKQAEKAEEAERLAQEKEVQTKKQIQEAEEAARKAEEKLKLRLQLDELTKKVNQIKSQNEKLEGTIEEVSANITQYEENRKSAEANTSRILTTVQANYATIEEKKKMTEIASTRIAELDQMLGVARGNTKSSEPISKQHINLVTNDNKEDMEQMMQTFNRQTEDLPNLNLDDVLERRLYTQNTPSVTGKGNR